MFDNENYFSTLCDYAESKERVSELSRLRSNLEILDANSRYAEDPNLDQLRRRAKYAVEELYDALVKHNLEETRRLAEKLSKSDSTDVINWDNLFKKLGRP